MRNSANHCKRLILLTLVQSGTRPSGLGRVLAIVDVHDSYCEKRRRLDRSGQHTAFSRTNVGPESLSGRDRPGRHNAILRKHKDSKSGSTEQLFE